MEHRVHEDERDLEGAPDFETAKSRSQPLRYTVTWPDLGPGEAARGLLVFIPGFGEDSDPAYAANFRRHVATVHGYAVVSVDYHCRRARPGSGAQFGIDPREHIWLVGLARLHGLTVRDPDDFAALCAAFAGIEPAPQIRGYIACPDGDLQNFGIVQALDHLRVLGHLREHGPAFDPRRVIALGSSHGGYIAHLMAKIAPGSLSGIIDNSAYVQPPIAYAAGGAAPEFATRVGGVEVLCRTRRAFSFDDRTEPDFYSRDADLIRDVGYPPHLQIQHDAAPGMGPRYRMVNAIKDGISPPEAKRRQAAFLAAAGFDVELRLIGQSDLDGRLFKTLAHGLDASLAGLADAWLPDWPAGDAPIPALEGAVEYPCVDQVYRFERLSRFPYVTAERFDRFTVA